MNKPVIDVVLSCEERKNILLFLKSGLQETEFILESLEMSRQDLLPNIRVLEDSVLIARSEDVWELTTIGKLMVGKDSTKVNELVARATSLHLIVLENLNQTAPEQARTSLQKAIEQTEMTRGSTIVALEKRAHQFLI